MDHIASITNLDPISVRLSNLNPQYISHIPPMIEDVKQNSDLMTRKKAVEDFNKVTSFENFSIIYLVSKFHNFFFQFQKKANRWKKRGISIVAMTYGLSVFMPFHVIMSVFMYDGSVAITHGGIEMGQGLNTKVHFSFFEIPALLITFIVVLFLCSVFKRSHKLLLLLWVQMSA